MTQEQINNIEEKAFWAGRGGIVIRKTNKGFHVNDISPIQTIEQYRNHPEYKRYITEPHPHKSENKLIP